MSQPVQVTPDLWVAQSRLYQTNSGIWLSQGQACLIDPGIYPDEIDDLARFVAARGATPTLIMLTHSHWDHVLGPERLPGIRVLAYHDFTRWVNDPRGRVVQTITNFYTRNQLARQTPFAPPVPDETFEGTTHIRFGDLDLRLTAGPGHAPDQYTIYHAESGTLWAADMLSDIEIPFVIYNWLDYEHTLAGLAELDIRVLVPGHGAPTHDHDEIQQRLSEDIDYLCDIRLEADAAVRAGKTIDEFSAEMADWPIRQPDDNKGSHRVNVEAAYLLAGGQADPTKYGWNKDFS